MVYLVIENLKSLTAVLLNTVIAESRFLSRGVVLRCLDLNLCMRNDS